jgi:hypothetical protein
MDTWFEDVISFSDVHDLGNSTSSSVTSQGSSTSVIVTSQGSSSSVIVTSNNGNSRAEVRGSPENDTLALSLNSGDAFVYPGAGNDIVRLHGDATKNIHDAPIGHNGIITGPDSGDDTFYFGTGKDILYYGSFDFTGSVGHDEVNNFESGVDKLRFDENGGGTNIVSVDTTSVDGHTIFHMADGGTINVDATLIPNVDWILTA